VYIGSRAFDAASWFAGNYHVNLTYMEDFLPVDSWTSIEGPSWLLGAYSDSPYTLVLGVPMLPTSGGSLSAGAAGQYNSHFLALAQNLVENNEADAVIRLGWEFNGNWYVWSANSDPSTWAAYWRQIVTTMRSVSGQHFVFDWNGSINNADPTSAYPGDAYVDWIGADSYDEAWNGQSNVPNPQTRWANYTYGGSDGIEWWEQFAAQHHKPITFPEWAVTLRGDSPEHGGGDDPYYIQQMAARMVADGSPMNVYFDYDGQDGEKHSLDEDPEFAQSSGAYETYFGG
jgi:hypothetical protein